MKKYTIEYYGDAADGGWQLPLLARIDIKAKSDEEACASVRTSRPAKINREDVAGVDVLNSRGKTIGHNRFRPLPP